MVRCPNMNERDLQEALRRIERIALAAEGVNPDDALERIANLATSARLAASKPFCEGGTGTCDVCVGSCGVEEYEVHLRQVNANLAARLEADPDRAAIATLDGLRKILSEDTEALEADVAAAGRILDWIGVAGGLPFSERVKIVAVMLATKQGLSLDEAERIAGAAQNAPANSHAHPEGES